MKLKRIFLVIFGFLTSLFSADDFRRFLNDNRGGLILPFGDNAYNDEEWLEYRRLKIDYSVKSVDPDDLPEDFCEEACRLVDEFHRKTLNENVEWMLYFDYTTGEVIYCWKGEKGKIDGDFNKMDLDGKHITSIHSHTKGLYSFPSPDNFDILGNEFEDYEIITSLNVFWIVEFKGFVDKTTRKRFQQDIGEDMSSTISTIRILCSPYSVNDITEEVIGNYLTNEIDKQIQDINLILVKKEYD